MGDPTTGYQPLLFDFVNQPADIVLEGVRGGTVYDTNDTVVKPDANGVTAVKPGYIILPNDKCKDVVGVYTKKYKTPRYSKSRCCTMTVYLIRKPKLMSSEPSFTKVRELRHQVRLCRQ